MKSLLLFYLLISSTASLLGQVVYAPVFINPCSLEEEAVVWYLSKDTVVYPLEEEDNFQSLTVPDTGIYTLHYNILEKFLVSITTKGIQRDTFYVRQLITITYVSNPSFSEFLDCDSLAQGKVITYYYHGQKRAEGKFDKGQPIDTLFHYYKNGHYKKIAIDKPTHWERIEFYETGILASTYNTKKRQQQQFYPNGQLQKVSWWKRNFKHKKIQQYYNNGCLELQSTPRQLKHYNQEGILVEKKKRKAIFALQQWFSSDPYDRQNYTYEWESYDSTGTLQRKIKFYDSYLGKGISSLPKTIANIQPYQFKEVFFYKNGLKVYKIDFQSIQEDEERSKQLCGYRLINHKWVLEQTGPIDQIHQVLSADKY